MSLSDTTNDSYVRAIESALEEVKGLNKATQLSLQALLERLGPAQAQNAPDLDPEPLLSSIPACVDSSRSICTQELPPPIPTPAGQKKISLKPSAPLDFDGDRSAGKAFLTSCRTYIRLRSEVFNDDLVKIVWAMSYMNAGRAGRWMAREFETEARNGRLHFLDWLDFEEEFRKDFFPLGAEAAAVNALEMTEYFQGNRMVDVRATAVGRAQSGMRY